MKILEKLAACAAILLLLTIGLAVFSILQILEFAGIISEPDDISYRLSRL